MQWNSNIPYVRTEFLRNLKKKKTILSNSLKFYKTAQRMKLKYVSFQQRHISMKLYKTALKNYKTKNMIWKNLRKWYNCIASSSKS